MKNILYLAISLFNYNYELSHIWKLLSDLYATQNLSIINIQVIITIKPTQQKFTIKYFEIRKLYYPKLT